MRPQVAPVLVLIAFIWAIGQTAHFGWNLFPATPTEAIVDLTIIVLVSTSVIMSELESK